MPSLAIEPSRNPKVPDPWKRPGRGDDDVVDSAKCLKIFTLFLG